MSLWVPDRVARDQQAAQVAMLARALADESGRLDHWNKKLREIDPHLQLVKARTNASVPGLRPGFWHVLKTTPGTPPTIHVHETPDGGFREPDDGLLRELREGDMWNPRALKAMEERKRAAEAAKANEKQRESSERREELRDRIKAAWNPGVRVTKAVR